MAVGGSAAYVFTGSGSTWTQTAELTPSDADYGFDLSVSISGSTIVVGAGGANNSQGAAYVFTESGSLWTQTAKLTASDAAAYDEFGSSVSISGDTVVVGAPTATVGANSLQGEAYLFTEPGAGWADMTETARLTASDAAADDWFGSSVSINGDTVMVGAPQAGVGTSASEGAVYAFTEPGSGWANVTQTAKLTAPDGNFGAGFGQSLSMSSNTMVVGASGITVGSNSDQGAAYVFTESASGWASTTLTAKLTASDGAASGWFGSSVSISGNTVVVGSPSATVGGNGQQGAAYVFLNRPVATPTVAGVSPSSGPSMGGTTVTITGSNLTGATAVYFGAVPATSFTVKWDSQITATSPAESASVVDVKVTGPAGASTTSSADQFTYTGAGAEEAKLAVSDGAAGDWFGNSVAVSGNTMVVGSPNATVGGATARVRPTCSPSLARLGPRAPSSPHPTGGANSARRSRSAATPWSWERPALGGPTRGQERPTCSRSPPPVGQT